MVGDPLFSSLHVGSTFDVVVEVVAQDSHAASFRTLWNNEHCRCPGNFELGSVVTLYQVRYQGMQGSIHFLQLQSNTQVLQRPSLDSRSFIDIIEVCAGIGGIASGCRALGGDCLLAVDRNHLACETLRQTSTPVVEGDLADSQVRRAIHTQRPATRCLLGAGVPCQGFSRQGLGRGLQDPRSATLCHVLQLAWHTQASGVVLECVSEIQQHPAAMQCIQGFAAKVGFRFQQVVLDLAQQWVSRRLRWWAVLLPSDFPALHLPSWPTRAVPLTVGQVIPEWPVWSEADEVELLWNDREQEAYSNPLYGTEARTLEASAQAPTALHSWGNALTSCPCGCRSQPISEESLQLRGLRGIGVPSVVCSQQQRFLHPREVALLNGLPSEHPLPASPRAALCLIGQLSSPMQAVWIFAHVRVWASEHSAVSSVEPMEVLGRFQAELLASRQDFWLTPSMQKGGSIAIKGEVCSTELVAPGPIRASDLVAAARASLAPGFFLRVLEGDRVLRPPAYLHPQPDSPTYTVQVCAKRARCDTDTAPVQAVSFEPFGASPPSQALQCLATPRGSSPASVAAFPSSPEPRPSPEPTQLDPVQALASPLSVASSYMAPTPTVPASAEFAECPAAPLQDGCTDVTVWCGLSAAIAAYAPQSASLLPPRVASALLHILHTDGFLPPALASVALLREGQTMLVPFVAQAHWTLLAIQVTDGAAKATVLDGIPGRNIESAKLLAGALSFLSGRSLSHVREITMWHQRDAASCGAALLAHALLLVAKGACDDPWSTAQAYLAALPPLPSNLIGWGGLSREQEQELAQLLVSKGVPADAASSRLQSAITKIGPGPLAAALQQKNVWQALKAAGSRPGSLFKWVQPEELQQHIERKAQTRFGTEVPRPRTKKHKPSKPAISAPLHIDPLQLQLSPGSFVSKAGAPLGQLSFEDVGAQATGVCFCTVAQAQPYIAHAQHLSVDALALVTTAELAPEHGTADVAPVRYPAIFSPTQEAILVQGSLVQLGDEAVQLAATDIAEVEHISTVVCRINVYRDECKLPWDKFAEAPLRLLLQHVPEFRVCQGTACDSSCLAFHAAVDETVEHLFLDVWARQWNKLAGGKTKPLAAELFQVFVRVPASALPHVFRTSLEGLYVEPRAADGTGPHCAWAVVWLPGLSQAQAKHALKTTERAIALARLGHKYGIRTRDSDEQSVFERLRPQHQFLKVRVVARYRLHPLPHGFQRHNLVQLLQQWKWPCKPMQPDRGDAEGCAWLVGAATEPPAPALPLGSTFVLATKVKEVGVPRSTPAQVCASSRTRRALLIDDDHEEPDPWAEGRDPWATARQPPQLAASSTETVSKIAQLEAGLKQDLQDIVQRKLDERAAAAPPPEMTDQDRRLHALETTLTEVQHQGQKFESWFQSFGTRVSDQASQLDALRNTVQEQQVELGRVRTEVQQSVQSAASTLQTNMTVTRWQSSWPRRWCKSKAFLPTRSRARDYACPAGEKGSAPGRGGSLVPVCGSHSLFCDSASVPSFRALMLRLLFS